MPLKAVTKSACPVWFSSWFTILSVHETFWKVLCHTCVWKIVSFAKGVPLYADCEKYNVAVALADTLLGLLA